LRFVSLLAVIGLSVVFGMVVGGKLNAPQVALAVSPETPLQLAPATVAAQPVVRGFADVVEAALPSVVRVTSSSLPDREEETPQDQPFEDQLWRFFFGPDAPDPRRSPHNEPRIGEGSGFVISADGYILTNNHVVEEADQVEVAFQDGREFRATVVGTDPPIDLALLKIDAGTGERLPALPLGDSERLRVGEWVIAIGNPLEFEHSVTVGVVSAKQRRIPVGSTDTGVVSFIQTDAAINFGNSGGPLLDAGGNVVGINTAIRRANYAEGIGFALPINHARGVIEQLRERGFVRRGYIGISMNPNGIDAAAREYYQLPDAHGVIVEEVTEGGPAERAGLQRFDIIREVDGSMVRDNGDLISKVASKQPGDEVKVKVLREGKLRSFSIILGDREEGLRAAVGDGSPRPDDEPREEESGGLGFTVENITPDLRERLDLARQTRGVVVTNVEFNSDAADKGIVPTMIISAVNDEPVRNVAEWDEAMEQVKPGEAVKVSGTDFRGRPRPFSVYLRVPAD
jgi:serine protease Do